ncbi:hypothetical protein [Chitinophaga varians]|uniref:hypothetical protein n=1 Tax=Chitinophaga varians TaxID=2202339 RepID=UPI00165F8D76|nr:hypothetical protein [Chitinophaga varians]MBC9913180.1 hypothetical protein [Chitinophaga varians]
MRIVKYPEFVKLPAGTVFCKFEPLLFTTGICVKGESYNDGISYNYTDFTSVETPDQIRQDDAFWNMVDKGSSYPLEIDFDRDGKDVSDSEDSLFVIYEKDDVQKVIDVLSQNIEAKW